jgi:hypothetical protein
MSVLKNRARPSPLRLLVLSCRDGIPLDRPTRWWGGRPSHTINHVLQCEESALLPLGHEVVWLRGFVLPKALAESKKIVLAFPVLLCTESGKPYKEAPVLSCN